MFYDGDFLLGSLHLMDVDSIADVSEMRAML
jgi:hypothetical protein